MASEIRVTPAPPAGRPRRLICARCGIAFECRLGADCWCAAEPRRVALPTDDGDCVCPACLRRLADVG
jgi:hypothetical protein